MNTLKLPQELEHYREAIAHSVRPYIAVRTVLNQSLTIERSNFGGLPYLPVEWEYPRDQQGKPMMLLAQINFAELPPLDPFPQQGLLQFYIADDEMYGLDLDHPAEQSSFKVVYFPEIDPSIAQQDFSFLPAFENKPVAQVCGLRTELARAPVSIEDIHFDTVFGASSYAFFKKLGDQDLYVKQEYISLYTAHGHKIGGYAHFTQEDPRWVHEDFAEAILLLQIDSDGNYIRWGDQGVAHFFIRPEDLQQLDFSHILYNWDTP